MVSYLLRSSASQPMGCETYSAAFYLILFQALVSAANYSLPFCCPCTWEISTLPKSFNLTPVCLLIDLLNVHFIYNCIHSANSLLPFPTHACSSSRHHLCTFNFVLECGTFLLVLKPFYCPQSTCWGWTPSVAFPSWILSAIIPPPLGSCSALNEVRT